MSTIRMSENALRLLAALHRERTDADVTKTIFDVARTIGMKDDAAYEAAAELDVLGLTNRTRGQGEWVMLNEDGRRLADELATDPSRAQRVR